MSFNELDNLQDLEAQAGGFSDDLEPPAEFTQLVRSISQNIFQITSNVASIHRSVGLMGTPRDTDKMRATLMDLLAKTRDISKDMIPQIRTLSAWDPTEIGPSERYEQQKLRGDFQKAATDFQNAQKLALEKEKDFVRGAKAAAAEEGGEEGVVAGEAPRQQERMQLMDNSEMAFNDQLIEERETEIQGIEQGIQELNEIFRDLATIVTEQGTLIGMSIH
jgi:t-SNARE complex subunit (syntaxin)